MSDYIEVLESISDKVKKVPAVVIVLAIFNYLILGILIIAVVLNLIVTLSNNIGPDKDSFGFYMVLFVSAIFMGMFLMALIGVIKMNRGRKSGFILYLIGVGLISIMAVMVSFFPPANSDESMSNLIIAAVGVIFIVIFATQLKHLN